MLCLFLFVSCDEYELEEDACVFCRGTGYEYCNTCLNRVFVLVPYVNMAGRNVTFAITVVVGMA